MKAALIVLATLALAACSSNNSNNNGPNNSPFGGGGGGGQQKADTCPTAIAAQTGQIVGHNWCAQTEDNGQQLINDVTFNADGSMLLRQFNTAACNQPASVKGTYQFTGNYLSMNFENGQALEGQAQLVRNDQKAQGQDGLYFSDNGTVYLYVPCN